MVLRVKQLTIYYILIWKDFPWILKVSTGLEPQASLLCLKRRLTSEMAGLWNRPKGTASVLHPLGGVLRSHRLKALCLELEALEKWDLGTELETHRVAVKKTYLQLPSPSAHALCWAGWTAGVSCRAWKLWTGPDLFVLLSQACFWLAPLAWRRGIIYWKDKSNKSKLSGSKNWWSPHVTCVPFTLYKLCLC